MPDDLVKVAGMEGAAEAGLEVAQPRADPATCRSSLGCFPLVTRVLWWQPAVVTARKGQAIREHLAAGSRVLSGHGADCL